MHSLFLRSRGLTEKDVAAALDMGEFIYGMEPH